MKKYNKNTSRRAPKNTSKGGYKSNKLIRKRLAIAGELLVNYLKKKGFGEEDVNFEVFAYWDRIYLYLPKKLWSHSIISDVRKGWRGFRVEVEEWEP